MAVNSTSSVSNSFLLCCRDVAAFRATAQELLSSLAWHLTNTQPSAALVAAADEAASPVEIEEVLQALTGQLAAVQAVLAAAVKHKEQTCDNIAPDQPDAAAMAAAEVAAAASADVLQQHLESLAAGVAALRSAAAAARAPFGWEDGPLVVAMRRGELLLVDELNLAEDAVLERLNRFVCVCWCVCYTSWPSYFDTANGVWSLQFYQSSTIIPRNRQKDTSCQPITNRITAYCCCCCRLVSVVVFLSLVAV